MFQLYGHFAHDSTKYGGKSGTLEALGLFRYGQGHVTLTAWPSEGKLMTDFTIIPPRSTETEKYSGVEDKANEETLFACVDSIAKFFHPDDLIKPNGIKGDPGDVSHLYQMGAFEVASKYAKDPFRLQWWTDSSRGLKKFANDDDLLEQMGSSDDWTNRVTSVQSPFQRIDIVDSEDDFISLSYMQYFRNPELRAEKEYMEAHPQFFAPDRMLYLDGVIQSTKEGLAAYHEALVQPAMFTHPNPKRVAIVGGGECATLRETLKHNTVETVVMVEIDPVIVEVSKYYLPEWNDCSMYEGSSRYCMDDPRVEMYHLDALKWFRDRFSDESKNEGHELYGTEEKFDVVILDAL
jgi:spermidine synthase